MRPFPLGACSPITKGAGLAQLVEHLICNQGVAGSIPAAGTIFLRTINWAMPGPAVAGPGPDVLFGLVVGELQAGGSARLDEQIHEGGNGSASVPVPLQFAKELDGGNQLASCLLDAAKRGFVRVG